MTQKTDQAMTMTMVWIARPASTTEQDWGKDIHVKRGADRARAEVGQAQEVALVI